MSKVSDLRVRLGNGHKAWFRAETPRFSFVERFGHLFDVISKDPASDALVKEVEKLRTPDLGTNDQMCHDLKDYFEKTGANPRVMGKYAKPWCYFFNYLSAFYIGHTYFTNRPMEKQKMLELQGAGVIGGHVAYCHYNAWLCGSQTFVLSQGLASRLLLTDVKGAMWSDFHLPFPAFVIQVPPDLATLVDPLTGLHELDTIVVVGGLSEEGKRRVEFLFLGKENERSTSVGDDATLYATIYHVTDSLDESVEKSYHMKYNDNSQLARVAGKEGDAAVKQLMRFALAVTFYLTDFPQDREYPGRQDEIDRLTKSISSLSGKAKRNAKAKLRKLQRDPTTHHVGTKVPFNPMLEKIASAVGSGKALPATVASYVRGHRKMQPHGPGRSLRKPIWVDPYWRNVGAEQTSSKTYEVK